MNFKGFKVGDIITGLEGNGYNWTTHKSIMKVVGGKEVTGKENYIRVKIIKSNEESFSGNAIVGRVYEVRNTKLRFKLINNSIKKL